jgi:hypothetical protein
LPEEGRPPAWEEASIVPESSAALAAKPEPEASYAELPGAAANAANYARWGAGLKEVLYQSRALSLWTSPDLRLTSFPGEAEGEFRVRVTQSMRERRDAQVEDVRRRHAAELATLQERLRLAQARVEREQSQYRQQQAQTLISLGATLLGALVGRKVASVGNIGRAASTMRSAGRIGREKEDIRLADESAERISARIRDLEQRIQEEVGALQGQIAPGDVHIAETRVAPRKSDIFCAMPVLAWTPWALSADGMAQPLLFP